MEKLALNIYIFVYAFGRSDNPCANVSAALRQFFRHRRAGESAPWGQKAGDIGRQSTRLHLLQAAKEKRSTDDIRTSVPIGFPTALARRHFLGVTPALTSCGVWRIFETDQTLQRTVAFPPQGATQNVESEASPCSIWAAVKTLNNLQMLMRLVLELPAPFSSARLMVSTASCPNREIVSVRQWRGSELPNAGPLLREDGSSSTLMFLWGLQKLLKDSLLPFSFIFDT